MLIALARRFSDQDLPKCFYESTFTVADGCPQRSAEEEDDLVMALDHKWQDDYAKVTRYREYYNSDDDEWGDDSDSEEETSDGGE